MRVVESIVVDRPPADVWAVVSDLDTHTSWRPGRFMIAGQHQRRGYGRRALDHVVEHVKTLPGAAALGSSFVPGENGPRAFSLDYGFVETGEVDHLEHVIRLTL